MITAVDAHACGEPGRVITGGVLDVPGQTMFDKKTYLSTKADWLRLHRMARLRQTGRYWHLTFNASLDPTSHDKWAAYQVRQQDLGRRVLRLLAGKALNSSDESDCLQPEDDR